MSLLDSARTQRRLVEWQARRGTVHVVVGVTVVSVVISAILAYPILILGYGSFAAVGTVGMLLPVVVPAAVAPIATHQVVAVLRGANDLVAELTETRERLSAEIDRRTVVQAELEALSRHDPLTGVLNRRGFYEAMADGRLNGCTDMLVTVTDIDHFKVVNDTLGHAVGDLVLVEMASRLSAIPGRLVVARLGGDEFVAVHRSSLPVDEQFPDHDRLIGIDSGGTVVTARFSLGTARHDRDRSIDATLLEADRLLYDDKQRRRTALDSPAMDGLRSDSPTVEPVPSPR